MNKSLDRDSTQNSAQENSTRKFSLKKILDLPNGENYNQNAALYRGNLIVNYKNEGENEISYNDILNMTEALYTASEFYDVPFAVVFNHTKPCGGAIGKTIYEACISAFDCDPLGANFATVAFSKKVDIETAKYLSSLNIRLVAAPDYDKKALEILVQNSEIRIVRLNMPLKDFKLAKFEDITATPFGVLIQDRNHNELSPERFMVVTKTKPEVKQIEDGIFGWKISKYAKTNNAVVVKDLKTVSVSQGFTNIISAVEWALNQAADTAKETTLIADRPIIYEECINMAVQNRVSLIIQPGGSPKDKKMIELCDKYRISMIFTGIENYKH